MADVTTDLPINPAVTFGFTARGVFPRKWMLPYWVVQFAGAICAALFPQLMSDKAEREAAEGGALPILGTGSPSQDGHREGMPPTGGR